MRGLRGKRIVVAGAASGIGAAVAKRLVVEGAQVIVGDINRAGAEITSTAITVAGGTAKPVHFDLAQPHSCDALVQVCVESYGGIDGLVNVAAELPRLDVAQDGDLLEISENSWHRY